jgi:hypothetical protein
LEEREERRKRLVKEVALGSGKEGGEYAIGTKG